MTPILKEGDSAPDCTLQTTEGEDVTLSDVWQEKGVVLFLYPKANTPGCTKQASSFRDSYSEIERAGFAVFGLSHDKYDAQKKWSDKLELPYPLLCEAHELVKSLGCSKSPSGIIRSVVVIEKGGKILMLKRQISPADSVPAVMKAIEGDSSGEPKKSTGGQKAAAKDEESDESKTETEPEVEEPKEAKPKAKAKAKAKGRAQRPKATEALEEEMKKDVEEAKEKENEVPPRRGVLTRSASKKSKAPPSSASTPTAKASPKRGRKDNQAPPASTAGGAVKRGKSTEGEGDEEDGPAAKRPRSRVDGKEEEKKAPQPKRKAAVPKAAARPRTRSAGKK